MENCQIKALKRALFFGELKEHRAELTAASDVAELSRPALVAIMRWWEGQTSREKSAELFVTAAQLRNRCVEAMKAVLGWFFDPALIWSTIKEAARAGGECDAVELGKKAMRKIASPDGYPNDWEALRALRVLVEIYGGDNNRRHIFFTAMRRDLAGAVNRTEWWIMGAMGETEGQRREWLLDYCEDHNIPVEKDWNATGLLEQVLGWHDDGFIPVMQHLLGDKLTIDMVDTVIALEDMCQWVIIHD